MKTIILGGLLGERFGTTWQLEVKNAKEACYAIAQMIPQFDEFMRSAHQDGIEFAVYHGKGNNVGYDELDITTAASEIFIDPVIGGNKEGVLQAVIGAVLVVAGIVVNVIAPGTGTPLIYAGVAMLAGGVAMMLMPPMDASEQNADGNKPNKGFGGAVTTVASGVPVAILYGERDVGGFFISGEFVPRDV